MTKTETAACPVCIAVGTGKPPGDGPLCESCAALGHWIATADAPSVKLQRDMGPLTAEQLLAMLAVDRASK